MANKKKEYYKPKPMTEGKRNIIQGLLQEYNIESAADIQEALKDLLGGTIKESKFVLLLRPKTEVVYQICPLEGCGCAHCFSVPKVSFSRNNKLYRL